MSLNVAIIGASHKPQRYAYQAQVMFVENGHQVFPISGNGREVLGVKGYCGIQEISEPVDTVTLYLNPERHEPIKHHVLSVKPRRIIFNPGTESQDLMHFYQQQGIETLEACTLVMLRLNQFN